MDEISFARVEKDGGNFRAFAEMWLRYMREIEDEGDDEALLRRAGRLLEIHERRKAEGKIFDIELCEYDGRAAGFCAFDVVEMKGLKNDDYIATIGPLTGSDRWGEIMEFYVRPEYRARGLAKAMFFRAMEIFRRNGLERIVLTPFRDVKEFWLKLGFRDSGAMDPTNASPIFLMDARP
ncbi:MAG: GNAT family N-acetyltransferase [Treponema sp.]|nr:GNAT family N-acetyltransferase [Treponema sp.]